MVEDPAEYRWSSYGEAVGGGKKGNGKKAKEGLVRACMSRKGYGFDAECWKDVSRIYRRSMDLALGRKTSNYKAQTSKNTGVSKNDAELLESRENETSLPDLEIAAILLHRIRYFTDGAVIGSKGFVNDSFMASRERFSPKRKDGARRMRGAAAAAKDHLWCVRDLRVGV